MLCSRRPYSVDANDDVLLHARVNYTWGRIVGAIKAYTGVRKATALPGGDGTLLDG
jgi:hypothetical protein